ncbi:MAG: aminotransferase class III-fold pyridoxal phosphate-dependent enzyme [Amphritea sp.]
MSRRNIRPDSSKVDLNDLETWLPVYDFIDYDRLGALVEEEFVKFMEKTPKSAEMHKRASKHLLNGVATQWHANDWHTAHPFYTAKSKGNSIVDVDGNEYIDFNFGDTPDMFGHAPDGEAMDRITNEIKTNGANTMTSTEAAIEASLLLQDRFGQHMGLKYWSSAFTASDANRFVIKMARIITRRPKTLMFNFAYHGTVDETLKHMPEPGKIEARVSMDIFAGQDLSADTAIVEFNDLEAVEAALKTGDIALVIAEPVFTNGGWLFPKEGFWDSVAELCEKYRTYLCFDETHTLSVGPSGYAGEWKLKCDFWTAGKSVGGGLPAAVYGFSEEVGEKFSHEIHNSGGIVGAGTYGVGTLCTGNHIQMTGIAAVMKQFFTQETYATMIEPMTFIVDELNKAMEARDVPFYWTQMGNRCQVSFAPTPTTTREMVVSCGYGGFHEYLLFHGLNNGIMNMPYFPMYMTSPQTTMAQAQKFIDVKIEAIDNVLGK